MNFGSSRAARNNNPGNLRLGSNWLGSVPGTDKEFVTFKDIAHGARATLVLLRNYQAHGFNTITKIISRYAPSTENNTKAYINTVCKYSKIDSRRVLDKISSETGRDQFARIFAAIACHESGNWNIAEYWYYLAQFIIFSNFKLTNYV